MAGGAGQGTSGVPRGVKYSLAGRYRWPGIHCLAASLPATTAIQQVTEASGPPPPVAPAAQRPQHAARRRRQRWSSCSGRGCCWW